MASAYGNRNQLSKSTRDLAQSRLEHENLRHGLHPGSCRPHETLFIRIHK